MSNEDQIRSRLRAVQSVCKDGRIESRLGSSYPEPDYDAFVTSYYDQLQIDSTSRGKKGEDDLEIIRDFLSHAVEDVRGLLAENERLRLKLKRAGKRVGKLVRLQNLQSEVLGDDQ